jgi:hypothetical protein
MNAYYNGYICASLPAYYNGYIGASLPAHYNAREGPPYLLIIMASEGLLS